MANGSTMAMTTLYSMGCAVVADMRAKPERLLSQSDTSGVKPGRLRLATGSQPVKKVTTPSRAAPAPEMTSARTTTWSRSSVDRTPATSSATATHEKNVTAPRSAASSSTRTRSGRTFAAT